MKDKWKHFTKPDKNSLRETLTKEEFNITQNNWTEHPFTGIYWNNKKEGIYVDKVSGEPLFSSLDKFDSQCGWASFSKTISDNNIVKIDDYSHFMFRTEVRSLHGDSHLGHVFDDGPLPDRNRYCINSASIRFIPIDKMVEEGYEDYLIIFNRKENNGRTP